MGKGKVVTVKLKIGEEMVKRMQYSGWSYEDVVKMIVDKGTGSVWVPELNKVTVKSVRA